MADVGINIIKKLWNETELSTWESLYLGLNEIWELDFITTDQYEDLKYAIDKLVSNNTDFPESAGELHSLLDQYM